MQRLQQKVESVTTFVWTGFYYKVVAPSYLPKPSSLSNERKKAAIIRLVVGVIAWVRTVEILWGNWILHTADFLPHAFLSTVVIVLLTFFTIGFMTAPVTLLLILLYRHFELKAGVFTLGTDIFINYLLLSLLVSSGEYHSLDAYLRKNYKFWHKINDAFLWVKSRESLHAIYFLFFLYYAMMSFSAILMHVTDSYWWSFLSIKAALVNSFLCKYYTWFLALDAYLPWLLGSISFLGVIFQAAFQLLMIPLVYFRWGSFFVKWHGVLFFLASLLFLNLSYLPWVELGLWGLIFFPWQTERNKESSTPLQCCEGLQEQLPLVGVLSLYLFILFPYMIAIGLLYGKTYERLTDAYWVKRTLELMTNRVSIFLGAHLGAIPPNVFNSTDLQMGQNFFVLYRKDEQGREEIVPLCGKEGERLNYEGIDLFFFMNHNSDVSYFGNTLVHRRAALNVKEQELVAWYTQGGEWQFIQRFILIDIGQTKIRGKKIPASYRAVVFRNTSASGLELWKYKPDVYINRPIMELSIMVKGSDMQLINYKSLEKSIQKM